MIGVLVFMALVFGWAILLGRVLGGTGTWLPTGGVTPSPPAADPSAS